MKSTFTMAMLSCAVLGLAACHTCPETGSYDAGPYSRTAGSGNTADYSKCHMGGNRDSYAYSDERTKASDGK